MSIVKPFKAVRPSEELAEKVAALPYDVMDSDEAREMVKDNPYSFLHIDKAEIDLDPSIDLYDAKVYAKARSNFEKFLNEKTYIRDNQNNFYIYKLVMGEVSQTGIVGLASIDDYENNIIKKHEFTREAKEQDRIRHVDTVNAHTGPIFLTHPANAKLEEIIANWTKNNKPVYDFTAEDDVTHTAWVIDNEEINSEIEKIYEKTPYLYIADGHHRAASAYKVGKKRREANPNYRGDEEFNYFLSVIFPSNQLNIMDYNRVMKNLNGNTEEELLKKIEEKFNVEKVSGTFKPAKKHEFGLYLPGQWYKLNVKDGVADESDPLKALDVSVLTDNVIQPIFGIEDQRTSNDIDFIGGIRGIKELEKRVNEDGFAAAIALFPTSIDDLMKIADSNRVMPPKSTWFEPKLRSGIFIHELD